MMKSRIAQACVFIPILAVALPLPAQVQSPSNVPPERNPRVHMISRAPDSNRELYLLSPGHYVYPPTGRADDWSPHFRPAPDYSHLRQPRLINPLPRHRLGRSFGGSYAYGDSYYWGPAVAGSPYYGNTADAYNQGRYDADHEYVWYIASQRAGRLINQSAEFFDEGILLFRDGHYDKAAVKWIGAADTNQGNGPARLHAGHAMFALGRYAEGVAMLARAFELSPTLRYKTYDIRDEYGDQSDFDLHLANLRARVAQRPNDAAAMTMLGYVLFFTKGSQAALPALTRAAALDPDDFFVPKLLNLARQASPAPDTEVSIPRGTSRPSQGTGSPTRHRESSPPRSRAGPAVKFVSR